MFCFYHILDIVDSKMLKAHGKIFSHFLSLSISIFLYLPQVIEISLEHLDVPQSRSQSMPVRGLVARSRVSGDH